MSGKSKLQILNSGEIGEISGNVKIGLIKTGKIGVLKNKVKSDHHK